jgi:hypothetical protein
VLDSVLDSVLETMRSLICASFAGYVTTLQVGTGSLCSRNVETSHDFTVSMLLQKDGIVMVVSVGDAFNDYGSFYSVLGTDHCYPTYSYRAEGHGCSVARFRGRSASELGRCSAKREHIVSYESCATCRLANIKAIPGLKRSVWSSVRLFTVRQNTYFVRMAIDGKRVYAVELRPVTPPTLLPPSPLQYV